MANHPSLLPPADPLGRRGVPAALSHQPLFWISAVILGLLLIISVFPAPFASLFGNGDPRACDLGSSAASPSSGHPFGQDVQGCDIWANAVFGTRASISVGVIATAISLGIAVVLGTIAGLGNRAADWLISRLTEVFLGFPFLLAAIIVLNMLGERTVWTVSLVLGVFGWPVLARLVRSSVRSIRDADYVVAGRTMGLSLNRIILHYVMPNALQPVFVLATISIGSVIVAESTLTYLGIGLSSPAISWGLQIAAGSRVFQTDPHILLLPSVLLALTVLSVVALGEELRSAIDPKERR